MLEIEVKGMMQRLVMTRSLCDLGLGYIGWG